MTAGTIRRSILLMEGERFDFDDWVARGLVDLGGGQVNDQLIFTNFV